MLPEEYNSAIAALSQLESALTKIDRATRYMDHADLGFTAHEINEAASKIRDIIKRTERGLQNA